MPALISPFFIDNRLGENAIVIVSGANQTLQPEEVQRTRDLVARAKVLICQLEIAPETTLAALKMAKELGGKLMSANLVPSLSYTHAQILY